MKIEVRKMIWLAKERLFLAREDLEEAQSEVDAKDRVTEDKIKWALAKISDLERLLNTLNSIK